MATKSLRCFVEIDIRAVTSPGTWLPKRDDVFVSVSLFGQVRQTRMAGSVFPLLFHDRLKFDKVFYSAYEPSQIAEKLLEETIRIELLQLSSLFLEGRLLAWYESNAKIFLYPSPYFTFSYGLNGREIVMERSLSFPGISPRMEFSTKTVIHETSSLSNPLGYLTARNSSVNHDTDGYWPNSSTGKRNQRSSSPLKSYGRSTLSSALKSKTRFDDANDDAVYIGDDLYASTSKSLQDRPPFVVRKVEDDLVARKPSPLYPRIRPRSSERRSDRRLLTRSRSLSPTKHFDSSYANNDQGSQEFVNNPDHHSSLGRYHDDYTTQMDLIRARIDRALRRNRSMERIELLEKMKSYYRWPFYYDYLDDLELELELGRRRRRYLLY